MDRAAAASRLSLEESEIRAVIPHPHGTVIETTDGARIIDITVPDGDGKTGLAFLARPDGRDLDDPDAPTYSFPVFRPLPEPARDDTDLDGLTVRQLRALAAEHGIDLSGVSRRADIIELLRGVHVTEPAPGP